MFPLVVWLYFLLQKSANTLFLYSNSFKSPQNKFLLFDKSSLRDICVHPDSVRTTERLNHQMSCSRAFPEACLEATFTHTHTRRLGCEQPWCNPAPDVLRSCSLTAVWAPAQGASLRGARAALVEWPSLSRPQPFSVLPSPQSPAPCGLCLVFPGSGCSVAKHRLRPLFLSPFLYHKPCARNRSQWEKTFQNICCFLFISEMSPLGFKRKSIFP